MKDSNQYVLSAFQKILGAVSQGAHAQIKGSDHYDSTLESKKALVV